MHFQPINYRGVTFTPDSFWGRRQALNAEVTVDAVRRRFIETGRFDSFDCAWQPGQPNKPHFFWDSDVAKWIEAASYVMASRPNPEWEALIERMIDCIAAHRDPCGYFNVYYTVVEPGKRFTDRSRHELYCAGHLIEAAVAYYEATGKDRFLELMCDYADYIEQVFVKEQSAAFVTPGHEEIELALIKLYRCTGVERYLRLAKFFIDQRGQTVEEAVFYDNYLPPNNQSHLPVREQKTAEGHAVRAAYLYSGMADVAYETGDAELKAACEAIFDNITQKRMYVTGGIGSTHHGEAFTVDYDLKNDEAYAESCAAIALALFASRMERFGADARYADTVERVLYNGALSSTSLDGERFFYINPMKLTLSDRGRHPSMLKDPDYKPITERVGVFSCSCCPPNIARFYAEMGNFFCACSDDTVYVRQYGASEATLMVGDRPVWLDQSGDYLTDGKMTLRMQGGKGLRLALRIPDWCREWTISVGGERILASSEKGYVRFAVNTDFLSVEAEFTAVPFFVEANPLVADDASRVAVQCGPLVYCAEAVDNGPGLDGLRLSVSGGLTRGFDAALGVPTLTAKGLRRRAFDGLYRPYGDGGDEEVAVKLIPYYAFANRGESEMAVWLPAAD